MKKYSPGNYSLVRLTTVPGKTMESLVRDAIIGHILKYKLFSTKQNGFISGRSTYLLLIKVLDKCTKTLGKGGNILVSQYIWT